MEDRVVAAIQALKQGKMILLTDDLNRENEADLIFPAEKITPESMNFIIRHTSGIVCVALLPDQLERLNLPLMVPIENNHSRHGTPFTVAVDAAHGITTGVSANDRSKTIQAMMSDQAQAEDLVRPGHIYPLKAKPGGVLERPGHTEGSVDIVRLAGFKPAAVLCEVMNPDGSMARGASLQAFAKQHDLPLLSIQELIAYRLMHENQIKEKVSTEITLADYGVLTLSVLQEKYAPYEHITLFKPPVDRQKPLLVRIHSACATGDIFHSQHCDCYNQLHHALAQISVEGGLLIYLDQEGRGIGLFNKIKSYALQKTGFDTVTANEQLGLPVDLREYYLPAQIVQSIGYDTIRLMTNNPAKMLGLSKYSTVSVVREPMPVFLSACNQKYLATKKEKLGHIFEL